MPWCPKCKNEYREGIKNCTDCGSELVEEEPAEIVPLIFGDEEQMRSVQEFLKYNQLENITLKYDESDAVYELFVKKSDRTKAEAMVKVFFQQAAERTDRPDPREDSALGGPSSLYVDSKVRARENRSSAWALLVAGGLGLIVVVLGVAGILPLKLGNPYMFYGVMSVVFLWFVIMGVMSMKSAKIFAKKAESENNLRDTILQWCAESLKAVEIDAAVTEEDSELPDGVIYFRRVEMLKERINHQFMNLDQTFVEHFIDEQVYDMVFGEQGR